ncbi:MAG: hypothetical protein MSH11_02930 [Ruminococcus sp.]|nr:hypothetical protein [Ruminococcus sp.]
MNLRLNRFMRKLKNSRPYLTKQQYRTIKGQALSGDVDGAEKGLNSLLRRYAYEHNNRNAAYSR